MTDKKKNGVQVSTTVDPELFKALDDHQWEARLRMTQIFRRALEEYAVKHIESYTGAGEDSPEA